MFSYETKYTVLGFYIYKYSVLDILKYDYYVCKFVVYCVVVKTYKICIHNVLFFMYINNKYLGRLLIPNARHF